MVDKLIPLVTPVSPIRLGPTEETCQNIHTKIKVPPKRPLGITSFIDTPTICKYVFFFNLISMNLDTGKYLKYGEVVVNWRIPPADQMKSMKAHTANETDSLG